MVKKSKIVAVVATLLIAAAGVITFEACNKKNDVVTNIPELNVAELTDMDKEMILFGEKMKSATKGGETMPLEEAIRNLSNYENFKMCDASNYSADMERLTIESVIPVNNGNVFLSDLNSLYESNKQKIIAKLNTIIGNEKTIYSIYSKIDGNKDGDNIRIATDVYMFGTRSNIIANVFDTTDYWTPCEQLGKCGPYAGQCVGCDAVMVIRNNVLENIGFPECSVGYRLVPYNNDWIYLYSADWEDTNSPNGHYGLIDMTYEFYCLGPNELLYYRNNILSKLAEWAEEQAVLGKVLINFDYWELLPLTILYATFANVECTYIEADY